MRRAIWVAVAVAATATATACSMGGGPAGGTGGTGGTAGPGPVAGRTTAAAVPAGTLPFSVRADGDRTMVAALDRPGGQAVRERRLDGHYSLPVVIPGRPAEGLSYDHGTLVLQGPASTRRTRFAVLDSLLLRAPRYLELAGAFSYDAISPDGSVLYLIEHLAPAGSGHYAVRALDVAVGRLRDGAIVDKRTPDEVMAGRPLARATSPDGHTVATLYLRETGEPFVHLLQVVDGWALCADLPDGAGPGWTVAYTGRRLVVSDPSGVGRFTVDPDDASVRALT